ncbi:MAG: response regulator receiver protein [Clostridia bacterium]|jgi:YesN/AraC family two-component response regulator|nr:response regulator receiver protein [Clostridia bacterium]
MAKILIVDDSSISRNNLSTILTNAGHTIVAEATNGESAFNEYKKHLPDLVTMDITMPILDGIGAVTKILKEFPDANIIMVSALDQKQMVLTAIQCGARHYIIKPFTSDKVMNIVEEVLIFSDNAKSHSASISNKLENAISDIDLAINDIDKTLDKLEDTPVIDMPKAALPFTIENSNQELHITVFNSIKPENFGSLEMIVQGFLYINPITIKLHLKQIEHVEDGIINKIVDLARLTEMNNAAFQLHSDKPETINYIKSKSLYLKTIT